jgi:hypothetical protein
MSRNVYGPYEYKGCVLGEEEIVPPMSRQEFDADRHGSFFQWRGQWYYIFNDRTFTKSAYYRDSAIGSVEYLEDGQIAPVHLTRGGKIARAVQVAVGTAVQPSSTIAATTTGPYGVCQKVAG